jgi:signal transduction histidine kinase
MAPDASLLYESQRHRNLLHLDRRAGKRRDMSIALTRVEDQERRALAKDLHDDLGQMLAAVALKVWTIKKLNSSKELVPAIDDCAKAMTQVNDKLRSMALQLLPPTLDELGLVPTLSWLAEEMQRVYAIKIDLKDDGLPKVIDSAISSVVYRAARELLLNVIRHSGGTWARIETLCGEHDTVMVRVTDSGLGFDVESLELISKHNRYGLLVIRERLFLLGGTLSIRSSPGVGTMVTMQVPLFLLDKVAARKSNSR